jgi:hypothetical protein
MKKINYYSLSFLSILILFLAFQNVVLVTALTETKTDSVNDVYLFPHSYIMPTKQGDFLDEIDIIQYSINGQDINITFEGDIEAISVNNTWITVNLFLFETFDPKNDTWNQLQYSVFYENFTGYFTAYFVFNEPTSYLDGNVLGYLHLFWDGDSFEHNVLTAISIGNASGNSIAVEIPLNAFNVSKAVASYVESQYGNFLDPRYENWYMDYCPNAFSEYSVHGGRGIPSYNVFIFILSIIGISLILLKKQIKFK